MVLAGTTGDAIAQPGTADGGTCPSDAFGSYIRFVLPGATDPGVDAAVATINSGARGIACEIVDLGIVAGTSTAQFNDNVAKRGRTTLVTYGAVASVDWSGPHPNGGIMRHQISIDPAPNTNRFSDYGDSGSAIVKSDDAGNLRVVGLLWASTRNGSGGSVASPIQAVLDNLSVNICA